jgi:hypothetical protein
MLTISRFFGPVAVSALVLLCATFVPVRAQEQGRTVCMLTEKMESTLSRKHKEHIISNGVITHGGPMDMGNKIWTGYETLRVYNSAPEDDGKSWSIVVTRPEGVECMLFFGVHWGQIPSAIFNALLDADSSNADTTTAPKERGVSSDFSTGYEIQVSANGDWTLIEMRDSGIGIPLLRGIYWSDVISGEST